MPHFDLTSNAVLLRAGKVSMIQAMPEKSIQRWSGTRLEWLETVILGK
jgi:hypothetical protein